MIDSGMDSTNGSDLAAAFLSADVGDSLSLKLMNLFMPVFSMYLAKNFTSNSVIPLLESAVAATRPDIEKSHCKHGRLILHWYL